MGMVDEAFCSNNCTCNLNPANLSKFSNVSANVTNTWIINTDSSANVFGFQNCSGPIRNQSMNNSNSTDYTISFDVPHNNASVYDENSFFSTWNYIETTYQCSGFCNTTYTNSKGNNMTFNRYLFSNVNNGIPTNRNGCYKAILTNTANFFSSYGAYIMCIAVFMLVILINLFSYLCSSDLAMEDGRNVVMVGGKV